MKKLFTNNKFIILLFIVVGIFFLPQLARGKIPISSDAMIGLYHPWRDIQVDGYNQEKYPVKNPLVTDPILQTYPWRKIVMSNVMNLELPLWNPYSFSGQPLMANIQSAVFQPLNILFSFLPFKIAWATQIYTGATLAAIFMYLFLRSINLSKSSSFFGAVILPFSSFFVSWMAWGTINITAAILPLVLLCINKLSVKLSAHYFLLLTGSVTWAIFSGHLQTASYVIFASSLYVLFISTTAKKLKLFVICHLAILFGILIASIQIIPTLEFANNSNRSNDQIYFSEKKDWFLPPQNLIQLIAPDYFGNPTRGNYWGIWNYGEFTQFVGIVPLIFALFALTIRNKKAIFFASLAGVSLLLALKNPISELPYIYNLPLISASQPSRILYLFTFSLVVLSANGFDFFTKKINKNKFILPFSMVGIVYMALLTVTVLGGKLFTNNETIDAQNVALRNMVIPAITILSTVLLIFLKQTEKYKKFIVLSLIVLTVVELLYFANKFTPFSTLSSVFPNTKTTDYLQNQEKPYRVLSTDRRIANPNLLSAYKIESISGYDPLYLKKYAVLSSVWDTSKTVDTNTAFNRFVTPSNYKSPIAQLMNVKYVLTFDDINQPGFEKVIDEGSTKLYRNNNALNRVFFVSQVVKKENNQQVLDSLVTGTNLSKEAFSNTFEFNGGDPGAKAEIIEYSDQSIVIKTIASTPTPLVISNINYPGWKAQIDGSKVMIENVNFLLQSIIVPAGDHIVTIIFKPDLFRLSALVTLASILAALITSVYLWKKSQ